MVELETFGTDANGNEIQLYRITNCFGEYVELLNYGASVHSISILNNSGTFSDVVLGANSAQQLHSYSTEGAIYGRCANRIADGKFCIDGKQYQLEQNWNGHCLHSASDNYAHQIFTASTGENSVMFQFRDVGKCGYRCPVDVCITYTWNNERNLTIQYQMHTEGDTLLSPTNHTYFHLGCQNVQDLILYINASKIAVKSKRGMPEGDVADVIGTNLDFTRPIRLGDAMKKTTLTGFGAHFEYDDNLILNGKGFRKAATIFSPNSEIGVHILTDMPAIVLYTPFFKEPRIGKNNANLDGYCSVCIETQYVSNAINCPNFEKPIFHAGDTLYSTTVYRFFTRQR